MKNRNNIYPYLLLFIFFLFLNCSSSNEIKYHNFFNEEKYNETVINNNDKEKQLFESFENAKGSSLGLLLEKPKVYNDLKINTFEHSPKTKKIFLEYINKYVTFLSASDNDFGIKNIYSVNQNNIEELTFKNNSLYIFGEGQYYIDTFHLENIKNTIFIGNGADETTLIGSIGLLNCTNIVISNFAIYYEKNETYPFSSLTAMSSKNILLENVWLLNSINGIEINNSSLILNQTTSSNNENINLYAYNNSQVKIQYSYILYSNYNGLYIEDSECKIKGSFMENNGFSGIYSRNSKIEVYKNSFYSNGYYHIQLKSSNLDLYYSKFINGENNFDYESDIYLNPFSSYKDYTHFKRKKGLILLKPKIFVVKNQKDFEIAIKYAEDNNNIIIEVDKGNYKINTILNKREDLYIKGNDKLDTKVNGYFAFASCYDIEISNIDLKFSEETKAFNGIEAKNTYFLNLKNCRIKSSKQNGLQLTNSIAFLNKVSILNSYANGISCINSVLNIQDSFFEENVLFGLSGINSNLDIKNSSYVSNKTQSGIFLLNSNVNIEDGIIENNGDSGIISEKCTLYIVKTSINNNNSTGLELINSNVEINQLNITNNEIGIRITNNGDLKINGIYLSNNQNIGIKITGTTKIFINKVSIRKSKYAVYIEDCIHTDFEYNNIWENIMVTFCENGFFCKKTNIFIKDVNFEHIINNAINIVDKSHVKILNSFFGENIGVEVIFDKSSIYDGF